LFKGEIQKISDIKCQKTNATNNLQNKIISSKMLCKEDDKPIQMVIPDWPQRVGCKQITSIHKPPHLRSKVRLWLISNQKNTSKFVQLLNTNNFSIRQTLFMLK